MSDAIVPNLPVNGIILALQIGHDATVTVMRDGHIIAHVHGERFTGLRHQYGIDQHTIKGALNEANIAELDVDLVAITFTQQMPALIFGSDYLYIEQVAVGLCDQSRAEPIARRGTPTPLLELGRAEKAQSERVLLLDHPFFSQSATPPQSSFLRRISPQHDGHDYIMSVCRGRSKSVPQSVLKSGDWVAYDFLSPRFGEEVFGRRRSYQDQIVYLADRLSSIQAGISLEAPTFHEFVEVRLGGHRLPAILIDHHIAHACSSYFSSNGEQAIVLSHDGGTGMESGLVSFACNGKLVPIGPHFLELGQFYDYVAASLGLGTLGGAGKLMGLASYGGKFQLASDCVPPPRTNSVDWSKMFAEPRGEHSGPHVIYKNIFQRMLKSCEDCGLDISGVGDASRVLEPAASEIAYLTQKLVQDSLVAFVSDLAAVLEDATTTDLCLTGGVALNCPTNTAIDQAGLFKRVLVEPHCEDGGLTIGACHYIRSQINDAPVHTPKAVVSSYAMMGPVDAEPLNVLRASFDEKLIFEPVDEWWRRAADALSRDEVIAICRGASETGPRALGARSILSNPKSAHNWARVNEIKQREVWRPFAPVCLLEDLETYFENGPKDSPFMLFTYDVRKEWRDAYPAITHVDGTARVQSVVEGDIFYPVLKHARDNHDIALLMNTSFNGPGTPIIQRRREAIQMLLATSISMLILDDVVVSKASI